MSLVKKILNKFNGLHYPQEYLCLSYEHFKNPLCAYLISNHHVIRDITHLHLFVGYHPLIFACSSSLTGINSSEQKIAIAFCGRTLPQNEFLDKKDAIAWLSLKKIHQFETGNDTILLFEGVNGKHHFVSSFHQFIIQLNNRFYNKKQGNVFLANNLYKQVQIAYSIPRKICLITVGQNNLYNHFPTDLHGGINSHYIISLRHAGNACKQVESAKRIVLSDVDVSAYRKVYALGKNHTQALKQGAAFDFDLTCSKNFYLPLPKHLLSYKELELKDSFMHGIHKLLFFKIIYEEKVKTERETLAHIHNAYASWRYKHGISSNLLLR
jgi:hypothetical protein